MFVLKSEVGGAQVAGDPRVIEITGHAAIKLRLAVAEFHRQAGGAGA